MTKFTFNILTFLFFIYSIQLYSQTDSAGTGRKYSVNPSTLLSGSGDTKWVLINSRNTGIIGGTLLHFSDDSIILNTPKGQKQLLMDSVQSITVIKDKNKSYTFPVLFGMLGYTAANILHSRRGNIDRSFSFLEDDFLSQMFQLDCILVPAIGAAILLNSIDHSFETEYSFYFSGNKKYDEPEILKFRNFLQADKLQKTFAVSIGTGFVYSAQFDNFSKLLGNNNYIILSKNTSINNRIYSGDYVNFNLLKNIQFDYFLMDQFSIAFQYNNLNTPPVCGYKNENLPVNSTGYTLTSILNSYSIFLTGCYNYEFSRVKNTFEVEFKAGFGLVNIDYEQSGSRTIYSLTGNTYESNNFSLSKSFPGVYLGTGLNYYLNNNISIGLFGEYIFIPEKGIPAFPLLNLPESKLNLNSSSIGISIKTLFLN